ncbi:hypothetical protein T8K17_19020 [Thalassobaculum sp. OXR-137]|uniref:hypothetical protein n=1 Tax=Thalassobaculum sp. OXR-137 TaxID=3100173 RepID=UPI002AC98AD7|nr:hypothetical protein [Thalassobaculum sp. OXR-137]WPZ33318.1 hypothetical protein T8K17_19020 [Thalassobaculum sp. OXR-137]
MKTVVVTLALGVIGLLAMAAMPHPAVAAGCPLIGDVGGTIDPDIEEHAASSSARAVRDAYHNNRCRVSWGWHDDGTECIPGNGKNHMTVRVYHNQNDYTSYHLFEYPGPGTDLLCTTATAGGNPIVN